MFAIVCWIWMAVSPPSTNVQPLNALMSGHRLLCVLPSLIYSSSPHAQYQRDHTRLERHRRFSCNVPADWPWEVVPGAAIPESLKREKKKTGGKYAGFSGYIRRCFGEGDFGVKLACVGQTERVCIACCPPYRAQNCLNVFLYFFLCCIEKVKVWIAEKKKKMRS